MKFSELTAQVKAWLQRQGRVSYRALKREFELNDDDLADLKAELIDAQRVALDEGGKVLVWVGGTEVVSSQLSVASSPSLSPSPQTLDSRRQTLDAAERRQLTVMFCDLVGSTALSEQLDPEEYREVIQAYNEVCAAAIQRFDGYLAKYMGDGLLVYFGYPTAHEDDAQRAVRAGLEIVEQLPQLNDQVQATVGARRRRAPTDATAIPLLQVRIGIHTGLVVAGEMGVGETRELLAIVGETPNLAARLQGLAEPNTVVISAATQRLVDGFFMFRALGSHSLKGLSTPVAVYEVQGESRIQSRFELAVTAGLTPLVGREEEIELLEKRWERVKEGAGQVVLLRGEAGIGKSRLVEALKETLKHEGASCWELRCSPYHQNSALYPVIEHLQRAFQFGREDSPQEKLHKLEVGVRRAVPLQADIVPLLAALLSLPHPAGYPPLTTSPQKQKQKTQEALVAWLVKEAEQRAMCCVWEDLHWADPSTLEVLSLLLDQVPTTRLLILLTFRPEFILPWRSHSHITPVVLNRLGSRDVEEMVRKIPGSTTLPVEVVKQIISKTDGVPLFVEEVTKAVLESRESLGSNESEKKKLLQAIPVTLHDALMARLDRLGEAKEVAQLGATLGREFSYNLLQAVSSLDESALQHALRKLVDSELLYQRGLLPQAQYVFKHALIQDTAYQSLLKSTRQKYHSQIAQVLEERFAELKETRPELLAHHYTEAGLTVQAIPYWQQAGQKAVQRSANVEAIAHFNKELELLKTLPDTSERAQQELTVQIALGPPLMATRGWAAPEVGKAYARARELCKQMGETPQLFSVLRGLSVFYQVRGELPNARELADEMLTLAQTVQDSALLLVAHQTLGEALLHIGELVACREHLEQEIALYNPRHHHSRPSLYGVDHEVAPRSLVAVNLWFLGYPDQALKRSQEALTLGQELSRPFGLCFALAWAALLHLCRREGQLAQERAEAAMALASEREFSFLLAAGTLFRGLALAEQGQEEEGIAQLRQGGDQATGAQVGRPLVLALLAGTQRKVGQVEQGLHLLDEAIAVMLKTGQHNCEAELYRIKGELTLQKLSVISSQLSVPSTQTEVEREAEECFLEAIDIARKQQAKSWELRAATSLARLWQQQGKRKEAHGLLAAVYNWFTEGFDTKDLQEAKALLEDLGEMAKWGNG